MILTRADISSVVLSAGYSSRMGMPKWLLQMPSGITFMEHIARLYSALGSEVLFVINQSDALHADLPAGLTTIINPDPQKGRFFSLQCGLNKIPESAACFIQNIDNPFLDTKLLKAMIGALKAFDLVVPVHKEKGGHPILISQKVIGEILKCTHPLPLLRNFLDQFKGCRLDVDNERILLNINTPEAYDLFLASF